MIGAEQQIDEIACRPGRTLRRDRRLGGARPGRAGDRRAGKRNHAGADDSAESPRQPFNRPSAGFVPDFA